MSSNLVIVHGLAATGKSTIAKYLASELGYVFLSKDHIKESLFDSLGIKDREWSKKLGKASYAILYSFLQELLQSSTSVVIETNFKPEIDSVHFQDILKHYNVSALQVLCYADGELLYERFLARGKSKERHPGHLDAESHLEHKEQLLKGKILPLKLDIPLIEIDTTHWSGVDKTDLVRRVKSLLP